VNTDDSALRAWVLGAAYRVLAVDGRELVGPQQVRDVAVLVPAGGRADLGVQVPADGSAVRVGLGGTAAVVLGPPDGAVPRGRPPTGDVDLLAYGTPADPGFDARSPDRTFDYTIGQRPGFLDGRPGVWWTVNGHLFPDVPMYVVREGDVVRMRLRNDSRESHPMHLHGHHALVLSRDGRAATGSPWWVDSLEVPRGRTFEVAFRADNPGIWMDHCHNLEHVGEGLLAHLAYEGVSTPFRVGGASANNPE
jgi:FtsP/CotA-like multicopper oxidase with cupredoxin domain